MKKTLLALVTLVVLNSCTTELSNQEIITLDSLSIEAPICDSICCGDSLVKDSLK